MSNYQVPIEQDNVLFEYSPARTTQGIYNAIAFAVLAGVFLLAILVVSLWTSRSAELSEKREAIASVAQTIGYHTDATIKQADVVLNGAVQEIVEQGMGAAQLKHIGRILTQQRSKLPQVQDFFVLDHMGSRVVSANPLAPIMATYPVGNFFAHHRTSSSTQPFIGAPTRSLTSNEWVFTISRRLNHQDGSFAGVVLARISISHFLRMYENLDTGQDRAMAVVMANGTLLWRLPFNDADVGTSIANGPLFSTYLKSAAQGTKAMRSSIDGVVRMTSFNRLADYPLVVYVARNQKEILAEWFREAVIFSVIVVFLISILAVLGYRLAKLLRSQGHAAKRLRDTQERLLRANNALELLAKEDGLTGVANRREFEYVAAAEFKRALRAQHSLGLLMLDIDHFKQFNDTYGHQAGDECLRKVSAIIRTVISRPTDLVARYGGEEFVIVLPHTHKAGSMVLAEKIRQAVFNAKIPHSVPGIGRVTVSIGVYATIPQEGDSIKKMLTAADRALYEAKSAGRNRSVAA